MLNPRRDVMAGLIAAIHALPAYGKNKKRTWMPATSEGMETARCFNLIGTRSKDRSRQALGDQMVRTCPATYPT